MVTTSPICNLYSIVVFPALSRPRMRTRTSLFPRTVATSLETNTLRLRTQRVSKYAEDRAGVERQRRCGCAPHQRSTSAAGRSGPPTSPAGRAQAGSAASGGGAPVTTTMYCDDSVSQSLPSFSLYPLFRIKILTDIRCRAPAPDMDTMVVTAVVRAHPSLGL